MSGADTARAVPSILFDGDERPAPVDPVETFVDTALDRIVDAVAEGHDDDIRDYFRILPPSIATVRNRQAVFAEVDGDLTLRGGLSRFVARWGALTALRRLVSAAPQAAEADAWHLATCRRYLHLVDDLREALAQAVSAPLVEVRLALDTYLTRSSVAEFRCSVEELAQRLGDLRYCVHVTDHWVEVRDYADEPDAAPAVERALRCLLADGSPAVPVPSASEASEPQPLNRIESQIAAGVATIFPAAFARLAAFRTAHPDPVDPGLERLRSELRFVLRYLAFAHGVGDEAGLAFCYPELTDLPNEQTWAEGCVDLALADRPTSRTDPVPAAADAPEGLVRNDFRVEPGERVLVVSGPNHGGKTTYARMVGQLHHLAALGLPIAARSAGCAWSIGCSRCSPRKRIPTTIPAGWSTSCVVPARYSTSPRGAA
ncbi:P-loop NTPase family protein [Tsukamurella soli]|uniref:hypothetical protein n=1 Tax=Tsukamurella soli TaxID=644556 RepID=UPI00361D307B